MDEPATSFAVARGDQRVKLGLLTAKTDLASVLPLLKGLISFLDMLLDLEDSVGLVKMIRVPDGFSLQLVLRFDDHILNPTQFDYVSRL